MFHLVRYCYETNNGNLVLPLTVSDFQFHGTKFVQLSLSKGIPSGRSWFAYFFFFFAQLVYAAYVPGVNVYGLPINKAGKRLSYYCNGYWSYYIVLAGALLVQYFGLFNMSHVADNLGEYLVAGIVIGDASSLYWYIYGVLTEPASARTGNVIYDFFMGTSLYPRITFFPYGHEIDIKMVAEIRWSWLTLMCLTLSCVIKQYQTLGYVTKEMGVMLLAHWLYSNATVKGEHYIPTTWDMFHERFGWMLNFWNTSGVPFLYCFQSFYILQHGKELDAQLSVPYIVFVYFLLVLGYYVFDSANSQKATMKVTAIKRNTFPQVPWAVLPAPVRFLETPKGKLLADGYYAFARKMQYTGDLMMALSWGLACGFGSVMPYFYFTFFFCMILHRQSRDEVRCRTKYGEFWTFYTKLVPNVFLPNLEFFRYLVDKNYKLPPIELPPHLQAQLAARSVLRSSSTSARSPATTATATSVGASSASSKSRSSTPTVTKRKSSTGASTKKPAAVAAASKPSSAAAVASSSVSAKKPATTASGSGKTVIVARAPAAAMATRSKTPRKK